MENEVEELVELEEGVPYFINEKELGKLYVVKKVELFEDGKISFDYDEENSLISGADILEIPNRNLEIIVEYTKDSFIKSVIHTLRKYAYLSNYDYVSYENYAGGFITDDLCTRNDVTISKVMPRLFRKILDN